MNKTARIILINLALLLCLTLTATAADINSNAGTSAFPFLKINISARSVGMGGAFTGLADDESSLYYNPAGLTHFEQKRFILGYHNLYADMQSGFAGYISRFNQKIVYGLYLNYLNYGDFVNTDEGGNVLGEFGGGDLLFGLSLGYQINHRWSAGGSAKFIYEKVDEFSATGLAFDLGARYQTDRGRFGGGVMLQNIGFQMSSLGEEKDKLPFAARGGVFMKPKGLPLVITSDLILPVDNDLVFAIGGEYNKFDPLFIRLGWNSFGSNYRTGDSEDSWAGLALGFGFNYNKYQISYAFTPQAELGDSHRITLTGGI